MHVLPPRLNVVCLAAALSFVLIGPAQGATTFGSDLSANPAFDQPIGCSPAPSPCLAAIYRVHPGNAYPAAAPISGVITRARVKSNSSETFRMRLVREVSPGLFTGAGTGPLFSLVGGGQVTITTLSVGLKVQAGDYLGGDGTQTSALGACGSGGVPADPVWGPTLQDGEAGRGPNFTANCEILANADIEADADGDGFGDETQDQCLGSAGPDRGCPGEGPPSGGTTPPPTGPPSTSAPPLTPDQLRGEITSTLVSIVDRFDGTRVATILQRSVLRHPFEFLEAGTVLFMWTVEVPVAREGAHAAATKRVVVARGSLTAKQAGKATVKVRLTKAGRRTLKHRERSRIRITGTFRPAGKGSLVRRAKSIRLHR